MFSFLFFGAHVCESLFKKELAHTGISTHYGTDSCESSGPVFKTLKQMRNMVQFLGAKCGEVELDRIARINFE